MKTVNILWLLCLVAQGLWAQQGDWKQVQFDNGVRLKFPQEPTKDSNAQYTFFRLRTADSTATLGAVAVDLSATGVSAEQYEEMAQEDEFWQQVEQGILAQMPDAKLLKSERRQIVGKPALYVEIERDNANKKDKDLMYQWTFMKGTMNHSVVFVSLQGKGNLKLRDEFFATVAP